MSKEQCALPETRQRAPSSQYRGNGHHVISKGEGVKVKDPVSGESRISAKRAVYDHHKTISKGISDRTPRVMDGEVVEPGSEEHTARYFFVYPKDEPVNFAPVGSGSPYPNEAHHLIPDEFHSSDGWEDLGELMDRVGYDINNGNNLIFMPNSDDNCKVHNLPRHRGSHPRYNEMVGAMLQDLRAKVQESSRKKCGDEWEPNKDIPDSLYKKQDRLWKKILRNRDDHDYLRSAK